MEMIKRHTQEKWILLYTERWLRAPFQMQDGTIVERTSSTPQGGLCGASHNPPYAERMIMPSQKGKNTACFQYLYFFDSA